MGCAAVSIVCLFLVVIVIVPIVLTGHWPLVQEGITNQTALDTPCPGDSLKNCTSINHIQNYSSRIHHHALKFNETLYGVYEECVNQANSTQCYFFVEGLIKVGLSLAIGVAAGLSTLILLPIPCCLCCCGFTSIGVIAGSIAACWQSCIGDVEAGSCFAGLQSLGATGLLIKPLIFTAGLVGIVSFTISLYFMFK